LNFTEFPFHESLLEGILSSGWKEATPIQEKVIPVILEGKDIIGCAQTGTGKTGAFLLPVLQKLLTEPSPDHHINALIVVPTRELAVQISTQIDGLTYFTDLSSIAVYGGGDGNSFVQEKSALSKGADIVVATPGKLISHINMGYVKLKELSFLILDEADRMLDMGFHDDIMRIIANIPEKRQTLLFSATMPPKIRTLAQKILKDPEEVNIALSRPPDRIKQEIFIIYESQKNPLVKTLLKRSDFKSILVFCSRKTSVKQLTRELKRAGFKAEEIHSDLDQTQREETLRSFASKQLPILVATDILSRGIDIDQIDLVINYDVPHDGEDYVHRIGRTARAETQGTAYTFVTEQEQGRMAAIERLIGNEVPRAVIPPELGPVPEWNPRGGGGRGPGGGRGHGKGPHRGGGGRPEHRGARPTGQGGERKERPQSQGSSGRHRKGGQGRPGGGPKPPSAPQG
jgi:superfamily II DNA/RNA helicase